MKRRLPIGAEVVPGEGVHFRVWAPRRRRVEVVLTDLNGGQDTGVELHPEGNGYFSGQTGAASEGTRYRYRLDGQESFPDPASRFQPEGPHGPSEVVDPGMFPWSDRDWRGVGRDGQVIYEMHVGTFTPEGTWIAATAQLPGLRDLGITVLEVMPVADFAGRFGWGYDGVCQFAPTRLYGTPDDFRSFVDRAHALGIGVILDVVYNHFGPDGCYLKQFSDHYFTDRYKCEWGEPINFDGDHAGPVREFFRANAAHWIDEYHLDGLRLDATQQVFDASEEHILAGVAREVRRAAAGRATLLVAENEPQHTQLVRPAERGGYGLDALWNDDFHHAARVALTGHNEAYYTDYGGNPQEFISAAKWGYLYQGQRYKWQEKRRGTPGLDLEPSCFVNFLQNHDQVANSAHGLRPHLPAHPGRYRALTALLLLAPGTPMLFQGQEYGASNPFFYFADHKPELAPLVARGRAEFLSQFPTAALDEIQSSLPNPADEETFRRSKLDPAERERNAAMVALHHDLLALRREDPVFGKPRRLGLDGAVLGLTAFVLRYFADDGDDRLLLVNLGADLNLEPAPEPLLAPPSGKTWTLRWSSEDPRYGGLGALHPEKDDRWRLPGEAAVVLVPSGE